jgi:hypothetical protein
MAGRKFVDPRSWHDTVAAVRMAAAIDEPHPAKRQSQR